MNLTFSFCSRRSTVSVKVPVTDSGQCQYLEKTSYSGPGETLRWGIYSLSVLIPNNHPIFKFRFVPSPALQTQSIS